jgi:hypothetical protein
VLAELGRRAAAAGKPWVKLELDPESEIVTLARSLGGSMARTYAWQIRLPDVPALLRRLAPVLERRIAASDRAGLSGRVPISLYRAAFALEWRDGKLGGVEPLDPAAEAGIRIPPDAFVPLVLGYRSLAEIAACWHDVRVEDDAAALGDALFPRRRSFIYPIY